jgi:hypothetical protein
MQDLDNFISPIPCFKGDIPILVIPISARSPGGKAIDDPSAASSAGESRTQANKWKATANPTPKKKAKKAIRRSSSVIKINKPMPKTSALTPLLGPRKGILIHRLYIYIYIANYLVNHEPLCRVPQDINPAPSAKGVLVSSESPKVDKPPESSS